MRTIKTYLCILRPDVLTGLWRIYLDDHSSRTQALLNDMLVCEGKPFATPSEAYEALQIEVWSELGAHLLFPLGPDQAGRWLKLAEITR